MKVIFVRHGQTIENAAGIIQGQSEGRLSEKGIEQARQVAKVLQSDHFDRVVCSDLQRCKDTASAIMRYHPDTPITYSEQLREMNFGDYQGRRSAEIDWDALPGDLLHRRAPNAESGMEMRQRVIGYINQLLAQYPNETILIVTHGGPIRNIMSSINGTNPLDIMKGEVDNCAVLRYDITAPLTV